LGVPSGRGVAWCADIARLVLVPAAPGASSTGLVGAAPGVPLGESLLKLSDYVTLREAARKNQRVNPAKSIGNTGSLEGARLALWGPAAVWRLPVRLEPRAATLRQAEMRWGVKSLPISPESLRVPDACSFSTCRRRIGAACRSGHV